ncbi:MAG: hypothetical protein GF411_09150, partial [Candidatus Lokiarchaeota archaeon]|nr:hypothetical protein [Candidatus Lokiarchaeota archaeon]
MNTLIKSMLNEISMYLLNPKWLIAPSMRVGYQWLDQVARAGQPALNIHVKTFKRMVLDIASPYLIENGQVFLQKIQAEIILHDLLSKALNESKYFRLPNLDQNLVQTFLKSINDLRQAGLKSEELIVGGFEDKQKGVEISQILYEYEQALDKNRLVDYADVLEVASEAISKDPTNVLRGCKILIPDYLPADLHGLELKLWNTIPELNKHLLSIDKSADSNANRATDSSLLGHILNPDQAPEPHGDDTVRIFSSIGEVNEIRGLFRFCMENRIPYDEVELLYTDSVEYLPLIYEEAMQYANTRESIPATFAEGIPIYFTSSGKALIGLIEWKKSNYPRKILLDLLHDKLIVYRRENNEKLSPRKLASTLRKLPIGIGRDNYLKTIDIWMGDIEETAKNAAKGSESPDRLANLQNEIESLEELKSLIEKLFECLPEENDLNNKLDGYKNFLENHVKCSGQLDEYGRTMLLKKINEFKGAILSLDVKRFNLDDWLADQIQSEKVGGQGPRPGCIYAAPLSNGGHSGRKFAFIVGMDDGRFPGSAIQDPILLDNERNRLSPQLQTTIGDLSKPYEKLALLLSGLRGTVILSYPCYDLNDDSEKFPSQALLSVFRIISGNHQGDQSDFSKILSSPLSFSPSTPEQSMSRSEWWINRLSEDII